MTDETKTEFKAEGDPAFPAENTENDNSAESSTEKTADDQTQSQEGEKKTPADKKDDKGSDKDNFADHPRWQEREEDWTKRFNAQETRHTGEISKLREEFDDKYGKSDTKTQNDSETPPVPSWWGGDEEQWAAYVKDQEVVVAKAEERAINRITQQKTEEQKAIDDATTYMNESIATIETDKTINPTGEKVDRNKLLKFVLDNELVDTKGRWNYKAGFQMMKAGVVFKKDDSTEDRKKLAGATTSEKTAETKQTNVTTSEDFSKPGARPW